MRLDGCESFVNTVKLSSLHNEGKRNDWRKISEQADTNSCLYSAGETQIINK